MIDAKITLIPITIALVSMVGFWKGPKAAGIVASLPVVAGQILLILALQMGPEFAKAAAVSAIASISASEVYNIIYSKVCARSVGGCFCYRRIRLAGHGAFRGYVC
jgi:hypothetical protein